MKMKIIMLGTGNAVSKKYYNTCFIIDNDGQYMLVDGGGGNQLLSLFDKVGININSIKDVFVTHKHLDHLFGIIWLLRMVCQAMNRGQYNGNLNIYTCKEVAELIKYIGTNLIRKKDAPLIGNRVVFHEVFDGEKIDIIGKQFTFFNIHSKKDTQFGFRLELGDDKSLVCCGDEPYNDSIFKYINGCTWLMHEAFCLDSQANIFNPYEKSHSTVKDACTAAENLGVQNLILYHTEDKTFGSRKRLYYEEGKEYFSGKLYIPDDLEILTVT